MNPDHIVVAADALQKFFEVYLATHSEWAGKSMNVAEALHSVGQDVFTYDTRRNAMVLLRGRGFLVTQLGQRWLVQRGGASNG